MRNVSDKSCKENQNTHFMYTTFSPKIMPFLTKCGNMAIDDNIVWRMRFACWKTKFTNPLSKCVILISFRGDQGPPITVEPMMMLIMMMILRFHCNNVNTKALYCYVLQGDQKVFVHLMIAIQKVSSNGQSVPRRSANVYY
jgi:hypothetical protein